MMRGIVLMALVAASYAQLMQRCSNYQTTADFDETYIETMKNLQGGYIVRMSNGAKDPCQRLQFVDGNDFKFTYVDVPSQTVQNYTDRYSAKVANLVAPAKFEFVLPPRVLGADSRSNLVLHPLIAREDMVAFVSCFVQGMGLYRTEQVLVFTPYQDENATSIEEMKEILTLQGVPRINELANISTECKTNANATVPFNLIDFITSPFGAASDQSQSHGGSVAGQTLAFLRGQYVPASMYANREQSNGIAAASAFDAFRRVSAASPTYYNAAAEQPKEVRYLGPISNSAFYQPSAAVQSSGHFFNPGHHAVGGQQNLHFNGPVAAAGPSHARRSAQPHFYPVY